MSEETKDPPVHEEEEKMCPYPDGGPGHMGLAIQGFWGSNKPSTARCMSCGGLIRVPDLPVLSAAVLQAELQTERDKASVECESYDCNPQVRRPLSYMFVGRVRR
jgi:hypothetical protein